MKIKKLFVLICLMAGALSLQAKEFVKIKKSLFKSDDRESYKDPAFDDSSWMQVGDARLFAKASDQNYWLRYHLQFPAGGPQKTPGIDSAIFSGAHEIYFNGRLIGTNHLLEEEGRFYLKERVYELPKSLINVDGPNLLAIKLKGRNTRPLGILEQTKPVGVYSELLQSFYLKEFSRLLLILVLIFIAFNLLRGFFDEKKREAYLLLSLSLLLTSIFLLINLNIYSPLLSNSSLAARIQFITLLGICPAFTLFLLKQFNRRVNIGITFYVILHSLFMLVIALSNSSTLWLTVLTLLFPLATAVVTIFNITTLCLELGRSREAAIILPAYLLVVTALSVELAGYIGIITIPGYYSYGLLTTAAITALHIVIFTFMFKPACKNYLARIKQHSMKGKDLKMAMERLEEDYKRTDNAYFETIKRLSIVAEYRDLETGGHIRRVGFYVKVLTELMGMDKKEVELLQYASYMHDVGKIGIPDKILFKEGALSEEEWYIMKSHTRIGADIFRETRSEVLKKAQEIALYHHERYDGSGYPYGLRGEEIPLSGQIMALADVYDALRSERPYKMGYSHEESIKMMSGDSGRVNRRQFSPVLLELFMENASLFDIIYNSEFADLEPLSQPALHEENIFSEQSRLNAV